MYVMNTTSSDLGCVHFLTLDSSTTSRLRAVLYGNCSVTSELPNLIKESDGAVANWIGGFLILIGERQSWTVQPIAA